MARDFFYIVGNDIAVRRSGKVKQQDCFDGPHNSEEEAHEVAKQIVVAGEYEVLPFDTPSRDVARQTYNHNLALKIGAGAATANKFRLQPKGTTTKDLLKQEKDDAWGKND
jgi:hypothetical protein